MTTCFHVLDGNKESRRYTCVFNVQTYAFVITTSIQILLITGTRHATFKYRCYITIVYKLRGFGHVYGLGQLHLSEFTHA